MCRRPTGGSDRFFTPNLGVSPETSEPLPHIQHNGNHSVSFHSKKKKKKQKTNCIKIAFENSEFRNICIFKLVGSVFLWKLREYSKYWVNFFFFFKINSPRNIQVTQRSSTEMNGKCEFSENNYNHPANSLPFSPLLFPQPRSHVP